MRTPKLARLEAALFVADAPLTSRKLAEVALLSDGTEARTLIRRLNELYDRGGSAFRVVQIAGGYRLFTSADFGRWLARRYRPAAETQLSSASLETLTIIAYRQPILRAEIEAIRGVQCGEILRHLLEKRMIRIVGRDHALGRPILYATSRRFLEVFGLKGLDDLPLADQLKRRDAEAGSGAAVVEATQRAGE